MATLNIGGKRVKVDDSFLSLPPDQQQATVDEIASSLNITAQAPQTVAGGKGDRERSWAETGMDAIKSAGTGLVEGAAGLVGTLGDIQQFAGDTVGWAAGKLGAPQNVQDLASGVARRVAVPGIAAQAPRSAQVQQGVEDTLGPMHQPETVAGQYARTMGNFAPNAVMGPGGLARRGAMMAVPALAAETAGQLTDQNEYARFGAALAGGGVAAMARNNPGTRQMLKDAPSFEAVKSMTDDAYKALDDAKIVFDQNAYKSTAMKIQNELRKEGLLPEQGGDISTFLNQIMSRAKKVNGFTEVDSIRKNIGPIAASKDPRMAVDSRRASIIIRHLDDLVNNGKVMSLSGVPRDQIGGMVQKARELARRKIVGSQIEGMQNKSEWYPSGGESGLRNQFASYGKRNDTRLSGAEESAFKRVVSREGLMNPLHNYGSRIGMIAGGIGLWGSGPVTAVASILGSMAARKFMEVYTMRGVNEALKTVLAGRSAQEKAAVLDALAKTQGMTRAAVSADTARRDAFPPSSGTTYNANGLLSNTGTR